MDRALSIVAGEIYAQPVQYLAETEQDDATLARRIAAGDAGAEAEFCRRFAARIRLFGRKRLRNDAAAADLVQDVLILALQKLRAGAVREPARIASFMLGTARQLVLDSRRNSGRRERILDEFPIDLLPLDMTFYDECPADVLGTQLGLNPGHVRVIRHRGLEHLRNCMNEAEGAQ
jgi:RNA polymerase sigma-70 factor (ECF subfamily)